MNQRKVNRLEMMEATHNFLDSNTSVWNTVPIMATYKTRLSQNIDLMKSVVERENESSVFTENSLQNLRILIAEKMDILDDVLEAYAEDTENKELLEKASNSKSDYLRYTNEGFETKVKNMIGLLEEHIDDMAPYGMTIDQIEDAKLSFNTFQDKREKPRSYPQKEISSQELSLEDLMSETTLLLSKLDGVMKRFRRSNATFYAGYEAARTVATDE